MVSLSIELADADGRGAWRRPIEHMNVAPGFYRVRARNLVHAIAGIPCRRESRPCRRCRRR